MLNILDELVRGSPSCASLQNEDVLQHVSQHVPFLKASGAVHDEALLSAVERANVALRHFRSSASLRILLSEVIDASIMQSLSHCWSKQSVKIRLDAVMKLLVSVLVIPSLSSMVGVGKQLDPDLDAGSRSPASPSRAPSTLSNLVSVLVSTLSIFQRAEEALLSNGSDAPLDGPRALLFARIINLRSARLIPLALTLAEHGTLVLESMTCHMLCVRALSADVTEAIASLLSGMRAQLMRIDDEPVELQQSQFSSSQLSTPSPTPPSSAASTSRARSLQILSTGAADYFSFLRSNIDELVRACRSTEIAVSVNPKVRAWLKAEEYESAGDILRVFHQKYASHLTHLPVPLQPFQRADIAQAMRDVCREVVSLNGNLYLGCGDDGKDGGEGLVAGVERAVQGALGGLFGRRDDGCNKEQQQCVERGRGGLRAPMAPLASPAASESDEFVDIADLHDLRADAQPSSGEATPSPPHTFLRPASPRAPWTEELRALLLSHILLAASRTAAGGDAFFIVNDLYGGEGLVLCPCTEWGLVGTEGLRVPSAMNLSAASPQRAFFNGSSGSGSKGTSSSGGRSKSASANVTISISPRGVRVVVFNWYSLFSREELEASVDASPPPLVSFRCTTTTLMALAEYVEGGGEELYSRLGTCPETVAKRAVSLEPFIERAPR